MGLNTDLKLVGNDFNNAVSWMFISNLIAIFPTGYIIQKIHPGKWLGCNVILWGVVTPCTARVTDYRMWYTKSEALLHFAVFCGGVGFQKVKHEVLVGWRIMFLLPGFVMVGAGVWALFFMPDSPMEVSWLTEAEK
ncbi:hypothetical protein K438DRAFT_1759644 [Mycena galopus ATCC 62051]|nr:hypothetical protein K438DRAFT_1759644 [Mycena galopus ATCC 62051]